MLCSELFIQIWLYSVECMMRICSMCFDSLDSGKWWLVFLFLTASVCTAVDLILIFFFIYTHSDIIQFRVRNQFRGSLLTESTTQKVWWPCHVICVCVCVCVCLWVYVSVCMHVCKKLEGVCISIVKKKMSLCVLVGGGGGMCNWKQTCMNCDVHAWSSVAALAYTVGVMYRGSKGPNWFWLDQIMMYFSSLRNTCVQGQSWWCGRICSDYVVLCTIPTLLFGCLT